MPAYTKFLEVLPDPVYKINDGGFEDPTGKAGQPFASVKIESKALVETDRTISGLTINRNKIYGSLMIDIQYNPMTREEFEPVFNFLLEKRGTMRSFYVSLPQYALPRASLFATFVQEINTDLQCWNINASAGKTSLEISDPVVWAGNVYATTGLPSFGDMFTIDDPNDSLHTKVYTITQVETFDNYRTGYQPANKGIRIHFTPGLQRNVYVTTSKINFVKPLIQVVQTQDIQEYSLGNNNLYDFSLKLEEAFY